MKTNDIVASKASNMIEAVLLIVGIIIAIASVIVPLVAMDFMGLQDEVMLTIMCLAGETVGWTMVAIGVLKY